MLCAREIPDWLSEVNNRARAQAQQLRAVFERVGRSERIVAGSAIGERVQDELIYICDGRIDQSSAAGLLRYHCDDDIIVGLSDNASLHVEFTSECFVCTRAAWQQALMADAEGVAAWSAYLELQLRVTEGLLQIGASGTSAMRPRLQRFASGQSIIEEGEDSTAIYVMIDGEAEVLCGGTRVGFIGMEEMFGEMGYFSGEPRSTTVRAIADCLVQVVPGDEFDRVLQARPQLVTALVRTQCQRIKQLNARFAGSSDDEAA